MWVIKIKLGQELIPFQVLLLLMHTSLFRVIKHLLIQIQDLVLHTIVVSQLVNLRKKSLLTWTQEKQWRLALRHLCGYINTHQAINSIKYYLNASLRKGLNTVGIFHLEQVLLRWQFLWAVSYFMRLKRFFQA